MNPTKYPYQRTKTKQSRLKEAMDLLGLLLLASLVAICFYLAYILSTLIHTTSN